MSLSNLYMTIVTFFLNRSKLKTFVDKQLNAVKMMISLFDREENTVGKGKHYQHLFLCLWCFPKPSSLGL